MTTGKAFDFARKGSIVGILLLPMNLSGQTMPSTEVTIRNTEVREIQSSIVEDMTYEIHITLPSEYSASNDNYPVVYYLDAYFWGGTVIETYRLLRAYNEIHPLILVGISYKGANESQASYYRSRDFLPTRITDKNTGAYDQSVPPVSGGAANFLRFLKDELKPLIARNYRITGESGLFGISSGALFATFVLFTDPGAFNKYLLGSPRLDRDNFVALDFEEKYNANRKSLPATVFMSVGSDEWEFIRVSHSKLEDRLRQRRYTELELSTHTFEGETHTSVIPATISRGFRQLYGIK